jgi:hypothetical protein
MAKVSQVIDVAHGPLVKLYDDAHFLLVEKRNQIKFTWEETTDIPPVK